MKNKRYICIRKLEKNIDGKIVTAFPGSYWIANEKTYWYDENVLTNEYKPEMVIEVDEYLLALCFKDTARR